MDCRICRLITVLFLIACVAGCTSDEEMEGDTLNIQVEGRIAGFFEDGQAGTVDEFDGVMLKDIVSSEVDDPDKYTYTFVAADGYQKTVKWVDVEKGIITREAMVVFPHLPKQYRVRDVVEVRVNE